MPILPEIVEETIQQALTQAKFSYCKGHPDGIHNLQYSYFRNTLVVWDQVNDYVIFDDEGIDQIDDDQFEVEAYVTIRADDLEANRSCDYEDVTETFEYSLKCLNCQHDFTFDTV